MAPRALFRRRVLPVLVVACAPALMSCSSRTAGVRVIPTTTTGVAVAPGFTMVDGTATALHLEPTGLDQERLGPTIHIDLLVRGDARASLSGVTVGGTTNTIAWPGGTPIDLTGTTATVVTPLPVDADSTGLLIHLDGGALRLAAGHWHLTGSVAVGAGGLGAARDAVDFVVPDAGASITFHGGAGLHLPPATRTLEGPGRVEADGTFTVRTDIRSRSTTTIHFGPGPYRVELSWIGGRVHLSATLEGDDR